MIECVGVGNCVNFFPHNPLREQFELRYKICVTELGWKDGLTAHEAMEADDFDKPGTKYLIKRAEDGDQILGVTRLFPTVDELTDQGNIGRFMISTSFQELVSGTLPCGPKIYEASRMVAHPRLRVDKELRRSVVNELVVGYMEYAMKAGVESYVALMNPHYWKVFERPGWEVDYLGPETNIGNEIVRVGRLWVNEDINATIRNNTGLLEPVLDFGKSPKLKHKEIELRTLERTAEAVRVKRANNADELSKEFG